ncbi:MAG: archease [Planctomycetes bacterium]|nr:archease [Planctomycetota bacterium]
MGTFTVFDHTADVGLEVRAESLADLLATAARAVFDQALEDWPAAAEIQEEVLARPAAGPEGDLGELLVVWLQELLFRFETRRLVPLSFDFAAAGPREVRARVAFGRFDPARHRARLEVKAVTYHGLQVREEGGAWSARFILDV